MSASASAVIAKTYADHVCRARTLAIPNVADSTPAAFLDQTFNVEFVYPSAWCIYEFEI